MSQDMLAILSTHPNHIFLIAGDERLIGDVADVREQISPLRRQKVNQIYSLGSGFQQRRDRRQEMDMSVGAHPSLGAEVRNPADFKVQLALIWLDLEPSTHRRVFKPFRYLNIDIAHGQLDLKGAVHVGKGAVH